MRGGTTQTLTVTPVARPDTGQGELMAVRRWLGARNADPNTLTYGYVMSDPQWRTAIGSGARVAPAWSLFQQAQQNPNQTAALGALMGQVGRNDEDRLTKIEQQVNNLQQSIDALRAAIESLKK
jgi:hypothetical protein